MHLERSEDPIEEAQAFLPFRVDPSTAHAALKAWLGTRGFFSPSDLKSAATLTTAAPSTKARIGLGMRTFRSTPPAIAGTMPGRLITDSRHVIDAQVARAAGYEMVVMGVHAAAPDPVPPHA